MLDPNLLRQQPADLAARLRDTRGFDLDAAALESLESERKQIQMRTQELQSLRNARSKAIGQTQAQGGDVVALMTEVAGLGDELKSSEARLQAVQSDIEAIALGIPNLTTSRCRPARTSPAMSSSTAGARRAASSSR